MPEDQNSSQWPRVANLRPRLREHVRTHAQEYRGERWYVLRDESTGRYLRFNALAYEVIGRLDGSVTVQEIWEQLTTSLGANAPSQDEIVQMLIQLHATDALRSELLDDAKEFFRRFQAARRVKWKRTAMNPLTLRIPLFDPDRFLNRLLPWVRPVFSWGGLWLLLMVIGVAGTLALVNAPALVAAVDDDILSPINLLLIWLLFPVIKAMHELGHAFAVKTWGGEVHEMGITLLVLMPVPYVDASAAWAFRERRKRVVVGAAGVLIELFLASLAFFVWLAVEPGLVRDLALNAALIGSVSTLLFNSNPLLRFDAYYVLQDLIEVPNLAGRASSYYLYLMQRYLFGLTEVRSPVTARGERGWFAFYGFASFLYRFVILAVIALFLAEEYLVVGVALASWAVATQIVLPVVRGIRFLLANPKLAGRRPRAAGAVATLVALLTGGLLFLPVPVTTLAEGVVWLPEHAHVYAGADGFVDDVLVPSGTTVKARVPLIRLRAPSSGTRIAVLEARHRELTVRKSAEQLENRVQSEITAEELAAVSAELELLRQRASALLVRSPVAGTFVVPSETHVRGRYLRQGSLIGYVITPERLIVRTVVPQSDIGLVREGTSRVDVRFAERLNRTVDARIVRQTPSGSDVLPSRALGATGGGNIAVDAHDDKGLTATEKVFLLDLGLSGNFEVTGVGERAYVRFHHGTEPLARQWLRSGRQLLLSRLSF